MASPERGYTEKIIDASQKLDILTFAGAVVIAPASPVAALAVLSYIAGVGLKEKLRD